jgi:nucleoside-diphosphate-sugar epimerase
MTRRVLLTGATGFIGRHALHPLRQSGFDVHVVGRSDPGFDGATFHAADLFNATDAAEVVRDIKASHLLHLAWDTEPGRFWASATNLDWVAASLALVRAFAEAGGSRAVMAGTCAEYRWGGPDPFNEASSELAPATLYGVSKDALRRIVESYAATSKLSVAWGRIFFLYGPGEKPGRLVSDAIDALGSGRPFSTTDGTQLRDFMHVEDVARAFAMLLDSEAQGAVNIASGVAVPIRTVLEIVASQTGGGEFLRLGARPRAENDPLLIEATVGRLSQEVGFVPRYSLAEGVADSVRWWRESTHGHGLPSST